MFVIDMWGRCILSLLLITMLSALIPPGQCQLLTNGGFENAAIDPGSWEKISPGRTDINGWVVGGNGVDYIERAWKPSEGLRSIDLSAYSSGSINTTLNTVPGTTYRLLFDMAGNPGGGSDERIKTLNACVEDSCQTFTFDTEGKTSENMGWQTNSLDFTATTDATKLAFISLTPTGNGPALDNVRVSVIGKTSNNLPVSNFDLTGTWSCNDNGIYYIRQFGDQIWWSARHNVANPVWTNVARGTISGNTVRLDYVDVPPSNARGNGFLVLDVISNDELRASEKSEGYGGSRWVRSSDNAPVGPTNPTNPTNPWDDPSVRQLIDEWLRQQDNCAKKADPGYYVDEWSRLQGSDSTTKISNAGRPDECPIDWDNYHYIWFKNECKLYYSYRVQDYVSLRQSGSSFDDLAGRCKGWYDGC